MAARKNTLGLRADWRQKIKTSMLINRLIKHALGEVEMSATQVRAAEVLLKKTLPDLSATEWTDTTKRSEKELTRDELISIASSGRTGTTVKAGRQEKPDSVH